jgi:hypothetical protein
MKVPKRYLSKNPNVMKREIRKHSEKKDSDSSAYGPWDADYKSRKAGKGKPVKTNVSKYTKKYHEMYGESESGSKLKRLMDYDSFSNNLSEGKRKYSVDTKGSPSDKALRKKAEKSGFPLGILKQVFKRGKSAWKLGHVPGTTPDQWAHARVSSFITGGKTTKVQDKALYQQAKKAKAAKK